MFDFPSSQFLFVLGKYVYTKKNPDVSAGGQRGAEHTRGSRGILAGRGDFIKQAGLQNVQCCKKAFEVTF